VLRVDFATVFGPGDFIGFVVFDVGPVSIELFAGDGHGIYGGDLLGRERLSELPS
jgi:hypothetical protein